ncbi:MAG: hypothetical protein E6Q38_04365 [Crocinitomicaceae bacterium]|nr:MAG: hypothetical protein E6Q38_04365 [Crocinitomicaceae bacterium]
MERTTNILLRIYHQLISLTVIIQKLIYALVVTQYYVEYPIKGGVVTWPYSTYGGTSQSTPLVSGTAALMYSVNPCLVSNLVQDILKNTTDPIVDAQNYPGVVGTGRLNAYKAVKAAQGSYSESLDLYIKDRPEDFGSEIDPYTWTWDFDESPDIWVRNQPDGIDNQTHQEPEYSSISPVYIYVRVRNKSCITSNGTEKVDLHWTKASSSNSWPQNWDGSSPTIGNIIGSQTIGVLEPGEETILVFTWNILNPYVNQNWGSCLMARIVNAGNDDITIHPGQGELDIYYNNNVALRNVTVIDIAPGLSQPVGNINGIFFPHGKYMFIGNPYDLPNTCNFTLSTRNNDTLTKYAEIKLIFDDAGWDLVKNSIISNTDFRVVRPKEVILLKDSANILNVNFPSNKRIPIFVGFSFYADQEQLEKSFKFDVRQYSNDNTVLLGAEHFVINKFIRSPFTADAGNDRNIDFGDSVLISAVQISESAIYNWYDPNGNLIFSGKDMSITPEMTQKYKLELIAISDGSISFDQVEVSVNKNKIKSLTPNPADNFVNINYILDQVSSSYLMIINQTGTSFSNYVINPELESTEIVLDNFESGLYTVVLICDGVATDAKQLIIN